MCMHFIKNAQDRTCTTHNSHRLAHRFEYTKVLYNVECSESAEMLLLIGRLYMHFTKNAQDRTSSTHNSHSLNAQRFYVQLYTLC